MALMAGSETSRMKEFKLIKEIGCVPLISLEKRITVSYGGVLGVGMTGNAFPVSKL